MEYELYSPEEIQKQINICIEKNRRLFKPVLSKGLELLTSGVAGLTMGIASRTLMGKNAYNLPQNLFPIGACFLERTISIPPSSTRFIKTAVSCELGYFIGVGITDYISILLR